MSSENGRVGKPTGLSQAEPEDGLGPPGFDPSRIAGLDLSVSPHDLIRRGDILEHLRDAMVTSAALKPEMRSLLQTYIRDALKATWQAPTKSSVTEGKSDAAWTATSGYKRYPPYVNLTGNRLTIREVETVNADPYGYDVFQGRTVFIDLPDEALRELASAIEARSDATPQSDAAEGESAAPNGGDAHA